MNLPLSYNILHLMAQHAGKFWYFKNTFKVPTIAWFQKWPGLGILPFHWHLGHSYLVLIVRIANSAICEVNFSWLTLKLRLLVILSILFTYFSLAVSLVLAVIVAAAVAVVAPGCANKCLFFRLNHLVQNHLNHALVHLLLCIQVFMICLDLGLT